MQCTATDSAGNVGHSDFAYRIQDTTVPVTTINSATIQVSGSTVNVNPGDTIHASQITFSFSGTDSASGIDHFRCQLDHAIISEAGNRLCTSPISFTLPAGTSGPRTATITAFDQSGNADPETFSFTVDNVGPIITISSAKTPNGETGTTINDGDTTGFDSISFSFFNGDSDFNHFECKTDNQNFGTCSADVDYTGLLDGIHTESVRGVDNLGNVGPTVTFTWTIDLTAPTTTIDSITDGNAAQ